MFTKNALFVVSILSATLILSAGFNVSLVSATDATYAPEISISCQPNKTSAQVGESVVWSSQVSGGCGDYSYSWLGSDNLSGTGSSVTKTYNSTGTKSAMLTVHSDGSHLCGCSITRTVSCGSVQVSNPTPTPVTASCSANPSTISTGQSSIFTATALGGTGSYTYTWSGTDGLSGSNASINQTYSTAGMKTATVSVVSGTQTASAICTLSVNQSCTPNYSQRCVGNSIYWYDSCGNQGNYIGYCGTTCTPNHSQRCVGNSMYWYDSCGNQGSYVGTCGSTISNISVTKTVKNLTTNTGFSSSVYANPSDMVMFMITVRSTGNQDAQNVLIRDTLPANLIYNGQLVVACTGTNYNGNCNSNNYNYSGNITNGVNLYSIYAGQTVTITYQAQVAPATNFVYGTTTLNNPTTTTASNTGYVPSASASVVVSRTGVLGASTISTGLTNNFLTDSFLLPLLILLIAFWVYRSGALSMVMDKIKNRN
jgi:fimbrial isopeptide formation D2 family protein